jgi:hypothetical protein
VFDINDAEDRPRAVDFVQGDIRDIEAVKRACQGVSVVHHNVALVPLAKDKSAFWAVNRDGTRNLLEACLAGGVKKVVNTSSSAVFGVPEKNPVTEDMTPVPGEDYGRAKLAGEHLCQEFAGRGLDVSMNRGLTNFQSFTSRKAMTVPSMNPVCHPSPEAMDKPRSPCAICLPNGVVLLNSGSVWMRLSSPDSLAKVIISSSVIVCFSVTVFCPTTNSSK